MTAFPIQRVACHAYRIPTDPPEADGTIAWDSTSMVVVEADAGDRHGSGGFTSHPLSRMQSQLGAWAESGMRMVKRKGAKP